jgi:DNA invertase Pin-like site-specific DNA recombinase
MRVAIYARVSTDKQDNGNQLIQLREFATRQGWEITHEFVDTVSGSGKQARPEFDKMFRLASQKKFDLVLFWKLDRLSREGVLKTLQYFKLLQEYGVDWHSFMEPFLNQTGIMRDVVISVMSMLAEQERVNISERTKAGLAKARRNGKVLGAKFKELPMAEILARNNSGESLRSLAKVNHVSIGTMCTRVKIERERIEKEQTKKGDGK